MRRYFGRKLVIYALTFILAVSIDWMIPRFMPGSPINMMMTRISMNTSNPGAAEAVRAYYSHLFGLDMPLWQQYLNFWNSLLHGNLGISTYLFPTPVSKVLSSAVPYDVALLVPSILFSWYAGNKFGAFAARSKWLDNTVSPLGYVLTATPYMWLGILLAWVFGIVLGVFPIAGAYSFLMLPNLSWSFIGSLLLHWFLPFASLFLVGFGGQAIGMRNLIIYELEADYATYLESLGAPRKLIRDYAFRNAILPQITGLALSLGVVVSGALVTEVVFHTRGSATCCWLVFRMKIIFLYKGVSSLSSWGFCWPILL